MQKTAEQRKIDKRIARRTLTAQRRIRAAKCASDAKALSKLNDLRDLAHRAAKVRGLDYPATTQLVTSVEHGTVTLDPKAIDAEVEVFLGTVRCHEECKSWVRKYGYASYKAPNDPSYSIGEHLCEVCALPMKCANPDGKHTYRELSTEESRTRGIYHGGNCYHVNVCTGCGHVNSVDSSD